ncbi:uncharacterized protein C12orf42 homolog isoform X2 [Mustela nigripes]|uniref:uncharacterized protein C12orf42 homolog isoform X2 n=1 Tax=Mustela nigripes TaxID=77151 RepID=UPI00281696B9|nr:uncharacterized protein C12orf42 homolog isoform X2 [Mustela nigripes]
MQKSSRYISIVRPATLWERNISHANTLQIQQQNKASQMGRLKNDSGFSQVKLKNSLSKNKFRVEIQTVLSGLQRYPEAGASPADCQERKKIHRHWLLYLEWFLNPSKKTTVMLASKQLKSTGAGSMHSPKINMT